MKSYNFEENKKFIRKQTIFRLIILGIFIFVMMVIGAFCYMVFYAVAITYSMKLPFWEVYQKINYGNRSIEELFAEFSIQVFTGFSLASVILYGLILWCFNKIKSVRNYYDDLREQIYDVFTMLIFLFGFLPLMLKFSIADKNEILFEEIDTIILIFLIGLFPPYVYSSCLKIYYSIEEKQYSKSFLNHMEKKINNNK